SVSTWAVGLAFLFGSIRAIELWRSAPRVDVVNVVVVSALAEGRGRDLSRLLESVGSAPYFALARAVASAFERLETSDPRAARKVLEREMLIALAAANRALRRFAWLDAVALAAIGVAGATTLVDGQATFVGVLEVFAATLLWLANLRGMRSIATRMYAGGTALVGDLVRGLDALRAGNTASEQRPGS
ncbi:MAG TPA: hypothetical protein VFZ53_22985, partial [Polyangiaceae bacterium]